jgi:hypothetical protein
VKKLLKLGEYARQYKLPVDSIAIEQTQPALDINKPELLMHGSTKDPYSILKCGLIPQETKYFKQFKSKPQVCMGLNNTHSQHTIQANGGVKNTAVKYADYFSKNGVIYVISDRIKKAPTYVETWEDRLSYKRGNATVMKPISPACITAVITKNLSKTAAAMLKANRRLPIYTPDGTEHNIVK